MSAQQFNKLKKIVILTMMLFLLTACVPQIKDGTVIVVKKDYHESYTTITYVMTGKLMTPITQYHDEKYEVTVKQYNDDKHEYIEEEVAVDKKLYDKIRAGDKLIFKSGKLIVNND